MSLDLELSLAAAAVVLGAMLYGLRARWFGHLKNGFVLSVTLVVVSVGLVTATLEGLFSYHKGQEILFAALVDGMRNQASVVEARIQDDVTSALSRLERLAARASAEGALADTDFAAKVLSEIQRFDPQFLQINVVNAQGELVHSSSVRAETEPVNRVAVGFNLDGKPFTSDPYPSTVFGRSVLYLSTPARDATGKIVGALSARYDLQEDVNRIIRSADFGATGYGVLVGPDGVVLAHRDATRVGQDLSSYPAVREALDGRTGWLDARNKSGAHRVFVYRPIDSPATLGRKPWVLLSEMDYDEVLAPIRSLRSWFALGLVGIALVCVLIAMQVAASARRPLHRLLEFVRAVREGDLTQRVGVTGRDEIGELAGALDEMVHGLKERDRVKEVFGRYVTTQVSDKVLAGKLELGGERRRVTMLFSDIRNFTGMSEQMTPEQVVGFLNDYFSEMVEAVFGEGGVLDKFIGDGMLAVFGSLDDQPDHARRAVRAALRMKALLGKINGERAMAGQGPIHIGIGVHTADVIVGNIGSRKRLEYTVIGDGVNTCSRVEALNKQFQTTILVTEETRSALGETFECREMPEATVKGKAKSLRLFEVTSLRQMTPA